MYTVCRQTHAVRGELLFAGTCMSSTCTIDKCIDQLTSMLYITMLHVYTSQDLESSTMVCYCCTSLGHCFISSLLGFSALMSWFFTGMMCCWFLSLVRVACPAGHIVNL